ncbi:hypothetical protein [uncultured Devosia sp.]|uniref:hypothetical protein n=1 Tax=uncultured Devosia sp. TaxID=211434 RepID=UPI002634FCCC|nr:hypothetical protein [uncultured Devosia sp.]
MAKDDFEELMSKMRFDTENMLNLIATSNIMLDAQQLYDPAFHDEHAAGAAKCHIYMIGHTPTVKFENAFQNGKTAHFAFTVSGVSYEVPIDLPPGAAIKHDQGVYILMPDGKKAWPNQKLIGMELSRQSGGFDFNVLYVGQAFGDSGSRNALDRLAKHETLQKISIQGVPDGRRLSVLLVQIMPGTRLITFFNPFAKEQDENGDRIDLGLDKLYGTSEAERTTLYEASFIRYFQPKYNKLFKNSFPSTDMKSLSDCYDKDIQSVVAEFGFGDFPYFLCSEAVAKSDHHIAHHELHNEEDRKFFFYDRG